MEGAKGAVRVPLAPGERRLAVRGGGDAGELELEQREARGGVGGLLVERPADARSEALGGVGDRDRDGAVGAEAAREGAHQVVVRVHEAREDDAIAPV